MLLDERVAPIPLPTKDEALSILARNYFRSHAPATLDDFVGDRDYQWKRRDWALKLLKKSFKRSFSTIKLICCTNLLQSTSKRKKDLSFCLLYDEYIIAYKYRGDVLQASHNSKAFTNGVFFPLILQMVGRRVIGKWLWHAETSPSTRLTLITTPPTNLSAAEEKARLQLISFHN